MRENGDKGKKGMLGQPTLTLTDVISRVSVKAEDDDSGTLSNVLYYLNKFSNRQEHTMELNDVIDRLFDISLGGPRWATEAAEQAILYLKDYRELLKCQIQEEQHVQYAGGG